jgi:hypothetical protein
MYAVNHFFRIAFLPLGKFQLNLKALDLRGHFLDPVTEQRAFINQGFGQLAGASIFSIAGIESSAKFGVEEKTAAYSVDG